MRYDGLDVLIKLAEHDGGLTEHLIKNTIFFHPDIVAEQAKKMRLTAISGKLPVRFSRKKSLYKIVDGIIQERSFSRDTEAAKKCEEEDIYTIVRDGIKVLVDRDGNYWVRQQIKQYTGEIVSVGKRNTIPNYMLSHIWGNTNDPYFFSALWNLTLTTMHCSFILDKPDSHHEQIKAIKGLYKALCWELYRPDKLMDIDFIDIPEQQHIEQARYYINSCLLNFIPELDNNTSGIRP